MLISITAATAATVAAAITVIAFLALVFFCVVCITAGLAHTEDEVLDGVVVVSEPSRSIVRDSSGNLYCLRQSLPVDTEIVFRVAADAEPYKVPLFKAVKTDDKLGAKVLRRVNDDIVVCEYGGKPVFVECSLNLQQECVYFKKEVTWEELWDENGPVGATSNTEHVMHLPYEKGDGEFIFPICYREA